MGAVAALLYLKNDPNICAAVFDSAFKSLKSLAEDLCKKESKVLSLVVGVALGVIAKSIESRAKFSLYKINPVKNEVPFLHVPAMFVVASADSIVPADHTSALYDAYVCTDKHIQVVKGYTF